MASLGPSVEFNGELSGNEDIRIEGLVDGAVHFPNSMVVIALQGRMNGDIYAESIVVEGEVHGNILGNAKVLLKQTGNVTGDIKAPRVSLEDGAIFKGCIEMEAVSVLHPALEEQDNVDSEQDQKPIVQSVSNMES